MSRVCELTGKRAMVGNNVSHAMNKTKRKFNVNLKKKRFYIPEEDQWITLKVSTSALKNIDLKENSFSFEPEVTIKFAKKNINFFKFRYPIIADHMKKEKK